MKGAIQRTTRIFLALLAALGAAFIHSSEAQDYSAELATVEMLGDLTTATAIFTDDATPVTVRYV